MSTTYKLVVTFGNHKGREFELAEGENLVGRCDPDSEEKLAVDLDEEDVEAKVSRQHAVLLVKGEAVSVEDLGSLNGTFLVAKEAQRLESGKVYPLEAGQELVFGSVSVRLSK